MDEFTVEVKLTDSGAYYKVSADQIPARNNPMCRGKRIFTHRTNFFFHLKNEVIFLW